jgi:hypothetical protein
MFGNLLGCNSGGRNKPNENSLINVGPIAKVDNDEAAVDFPNMLKPLGTTATITQGDQAGEEVQPAPPHFRQTLGVGT